MAQLYTDYWDDSQAWESRTGPEQYARVIHIVRNPLDALWSWWHFLRDKGDHTSRQAGVDQLGLEHLAEVDLMAHAWVQHTAYWIGRASTPVHALLSAQPKHAMILRYEDLRGSHQLFHLARALQLLLPRSELPPLSKLICADDDRPGAVAYTSAKRALFSGWDRFTPELREHVLGIVKKWWCELGFEGLLREHRGITGVDCT